MEKFLITRDDLNKNYRYKMQTRQIDFKIKPVPKNNEPINWIKDAVNQIVQKSVENVTPDEKIGFSFCSKDFTRGEGYLSFRDAHSVKFNDIWDMISSIYQSNSTGMNTETFCLKATYIQLHRGKGKPRGSKYNTFIEESLHRKGVVTIKNDDNLCLPRALVVAIAYADRDPNCKAIRQNRRKIQTQKAYELMRNSNVEIPEDGASLAELDQFQKYLQDYKITAYNYGHKGRDVFYEGAGAVDSNKRLNLLYHKNHFNVITSLSSVFRSRYFCEHCHTPYDHKNGHRCEKNCPCCNYTPPCQLDVKITCQDCYRFFRSQNCYENHLKSTSKGQSYCILVKRCKLCLKNVRTNRKHVCCEFFCKTCQEFVPGEHMCYIKPDMGKPKTEDILFVFYDLETRQETILADGNKLHETNLCVFQQCCSFCIDNYENITNCEKCGIILQVLKTNPIQNFVEYLLNQRKRFKKIVVIAHNGQSFDHCFILNHILTKTDLKPELILRGTKIIKMEIDNVVFLDSLNYFPMPLSELPKAFGLPDNFKKGYFPYLFNTIENQNYVGQLPSIEYYAPDNMNNKTRLEFLKWYDLNKNNVFDFKNEFEEYCISDVKILTKACLKFRDMLLKNCNVCPFTESCTIASTCNKVYRRNFLEPNTIGIIPKTGYRWKNNQSRIGIQWLLWEEKQRNIKICHAGNSEERLINGVHVDGFSEETNQVFEFMGCYWHGHPCITEGRDVPLAPLDTLNSRRETTLARSDRLRNLGYEVIEMYECEFRKLMQENPEISKYTENHVMLKHTPLVVRDAFYGGRTGNVFEYYKTKENEKIRYIDICSLYPWTCKYGKFTAGHPKIYLGKDCINLDLKKICGLIKCEILPPDDLYHPVLPMKANNKLMFGLCRTCVEKMNSEECNHTEEERVLRGTWVIDEVLKAVEKGYDIKEISEIYSYDVMQYKPHSNDKGLFTDMMNKFVKIKQESSGWPSHCITDEQKNAYIEEFFEREDIRLEFANIVDNPGLRSLAKLILNSFWGKFGQRENQPQTKIVNTEGELAHLLTHPSFEVNSILPINEDTLLVNYTNTEESYDELPTANVAIASFVTAQARLKLYSYLELLEDRVLYYDTDSVIYVSKPGDFEIPTVNFLGEMTDELEKEGVGSFITEFVSSGPKSYAFKVFSTKDNTEKIVCKVKGICLNHNASELINFESIKNSVLDKSSEILIKSQNIRRTENYSIITKTEEKKFRANSTKRKFFDNHSSVPYGYKKRKL